MEKNFCQVRPKRKILTVRKISDRFFGKKEFFRQNGFFCVGQKKKAFCLIAFSATFFRVRFSFDFEDIRLWIRAPLLPAATIPLLGKKILIDCGSAAAGKGEKTAGLKK